ncbi:MULTISPECIES: fumarate reductase (CoM/CoB) subunit TfrA [Methanobrevibacter]|uniref:Fumarate reductase (CoM/CoB) subunit A n=1 Tax=Methanobrevibacter gottschalkii DSM 11977 TaxID=1122229 RepID=A0A3N5BSW3_9EURY|nr:MULTISPECIES: fumarate reductase (CoM/CoB) subunit TfrA [Methanobrevibacter]OEC93739.1 fumarate reductase subunit A [Methanobrevibacter sp. A27]RPF52848.1 fumarate reductase (CoM/CoB) subunit A [Methanobrevibacter gottschalkii DSM 11977]
MKIKTISTDVLIIGSGGAGSRAAIEVDNAGLKAIIVSKGLSFRSGCTGMAEGGYNAVFKTVDKDDSKEAHIYDTLKGGSYLNDEKLVEILVNESPQRLIDLENYGALFDRQESGEIDQRPFGGQTYRRTCYQGDRTGAELLNALKEEIIKRDIECIEEVMITSLITDKNQVIGATGLDLKDSSLIYFKAKSTILASGGAGQLYPVTSNTFQKNGDGYAIAYKAGAKLIDMEQVQFHPTGMVAPESKKGVLVTEAVRAEGGKLLNKDGARFMRKYAPEKMELATRDIVARSIYQEIIEGRGTEKGGVYLDISHLDDDYIDEKLETMVLQFNNVSIDIKHEPIEVAPTAHHFMGGLKINTDASTSLRNLFGAGEVCGGVHGANRLGGNALADTQVFGKIAGESASKACADTEIKTDYEQVKRESSRIENLIKKGNIKPQKFKENIKNLMWEKVAIVRDEKTLNEGLKDLQDMQKELNNLDVSDKKQYNTELVTALEVINMVEICILIVKSAILRRESRGSHFRSDFPESKDEWKKSIIFNKDKIEFEAR